MSVYIMEVTKCASVKCGYKEVVFTHYGVIQLRKYKSILKPQRRLILCETGFESAKIVAS